jgi:hypothetical protein
MNDDLKKSQRRHSSIDGSQAFAMAELIALRYRDSLNNEQNKAVADEVARLISEVAATWVGE